jgi:endoglucanase
MKRISLLGLATSALWFATGAILPAATPWLHTSGNKIYDPNNNQTILRGVSTIDIGAQQVWDGGVTSLIDRLTNPNDSQGSSPGFYTRVVRLPVMPQSYGSPWTWAPNDGDNFYNNLLRPVVNYCKSKDIYCIIDLHYIEDITGGNAGAVQQFWTYMAPRFANDSNVIFELYNEPINNGNGSDAANWNVVKGYMQTWYNVVRNYAPNNLVLIGTPNWSSAVGAAAGSPLSGSNIAYVCHLYPWHWTQSWNKNQLTSAAASVPVFMTEWGFTQTSDTLLNGSISGYGQPLMNLLDQYGISWTSWVAHYSWAPPMFNSNWTLRVGPNEMGGFVKDSLYARRNSNQPGGGGGGGGSTPGNGTFKVLSRNSGKALDAYGNGTADGTQIIQWTYSGGNNQRWTLQDRGGSQYSIIGVASGKALDVNGYATADGTKVQLWTYGGGNNQKWTFSSVGSGYYRVTPVHATGSCLDVSGASTADGALVQLWTNYGSNNQQWSFSSP